jgi:hypothetical protein
MVVPALEAAISALEALQRKSPTYAIARYWYRQAQRPIPSKPLTAEWTEIAKRNFHRILDSSAELLCDLRKSAPTVIARLDPHTETKPYRRNAPIPVLRHGSRNEGRGVVRGSRKRGADTVRILALEVLGGLDGNRPVDAIRARRAIDRDLKPHPEWLSHLPQSSSTSRRTAAQVLGLEPAA